MESSSLALLRRLDQEGATGLDMSPGDTIAKEAATEIRALRSELERERTEVERLKACLHTCDKHEKTHEPSTPSDACLFCVMEYRDLEIVRERELSFRTRAEKAEAELLDAQHGEALALDRLAEIEPYAIKYHEQTYVAGLARKERDRADALAAELAAVKAERDKLPKGALYPDLYCPRCNRAFRFGEESTARLCVPCCSEMVDPVAEPLRKELVALKALKGE